MASKKRGRVTFPELPCGCGSLLAPPSRGPEKKRRRECMAIGGDKLLRVCRCGRFWRLSWVEVSAPKEEDRDAAE